MQNNTHVLNDTKRLRCDGMCILTHAGGYENLTNRNKNILVQIIFCDDSLQHSKQKKNVTASKFERKKQKQNKIIMKINENVYAQINLYLNRFFTHFSFFIKTFDIFSLQFIYNVYKFFFLYLSFSILR